MSEESKRSSLKRTGEIFEEETLELAPPTDTTHFKEEFAPGRFLVYSSFNGQNFIHIREFGFTKEREYPTRKGVCLTPGHLRALRERVARIDNILAQLETNTTYIIPVKRGDPLFKEHLGGAIFATVSQNYLGVNLRRYFQPPAQNIQTLPTKNGIYLPLTQWSSLKAKLDELYDVYPELNNAVECHATHGGNQMEYFSCRECSPFGYDEVDCL